MRRVPPVVVPAAIAAFVILVLLLTSGPAAITLRSGLRPTAPQPVSNLKSCAQGPVLPKDTDAVRVRPVPGKPVPTLARVQSTENFSIPSVGAPRRDGQDLVYRLAKPVDRDRLGLSVCFEAPAGAQLAGDYDQAWVTLLGDHRSNWLSAIPLLSERAGFGRGTVLGTAALPIGIALMLGAWALALRLGSGPMRLPGRIDRRTVALLGLVATMSSVAFAVTTPPYETPDEMVHLRYAELIVDRFELPRTKTIQPAKGQSLQLQSSLATTGVNLVAFSPDRRPPWTGVEDRQVDETLHKLPAGGSSDTFDNASSQPPAYYALVAAGMKITGGSILDRLLVARLISALLFGLGVAGAVAFAREAVPRAGGLVVAAGLALACMPLVGFIGGSVNPDALLMTASAWSLAVTARILRRGLTLKLALALGGLIGLGMMAKLTYIGLLPGFVAAGLVVLWRGVRGGRGLRTLGLLAAAAGVIVVLALPYFAWALESGRGVVFGPPTPPTAPLTTRMLFVYSFELYFGQFGPIADRILGSGPLDIWAPGLTGIFGWGDYAFPRNVVHVAMGISGVLLALAVAGLARSARARRTLPADAVVYAVVVAGMCLTIARAGLVNRLGGAVGFEQARYLFPIAAIAVGGIALALRTLPREGVRNWGAALLVATALVWMTGGYLMTIGRYFA